MFGRATIDHHVGHWPTFLVLLCNGCYVQLCHTTACLWLLLLAMNGNSKIPRDKCGNT